MPVKKVEDVKIAGMGIQRFIGFVDGIGFQRDIVAAFYCKALAFTGLKCNGVVKVFYAHKT